MPPQGESGGMALEDAILFARVLAVNDRKPLHEQFLAYEKLRRPRVDKAYQEATFGWDTQKDSGWIAFYLRSWITSWFLWWTSASRLKRYSEDIGSIDLNVDG
jgi:2-polyprenyl-6-methoxyphenol hydroxylase-like FAD-dependent oxidoreductase